MNAFRIVPAGVVVVLCVVGAAGVAVAAPTKAPKAGSGAGGAPASQPASQPAKPGKVGNIRYTAPAGWEVTQKEKEQIAVLNPPGETPKTCSVILVSGEAPADGDFLKWFDEKWEKLCQGVPVKQGGDVVVKKGQGGVDVLYQTALLEDEKQNTTGVLFYAAKVGDGVEWAVFQTVGVARFNKYNKPVSAMLGSLRFERKEVVKPGTADPPQQPAEKPAPKAGKKTN